MRLERFGQLGGPHGAGHLGGFEELDLDTPLTKYTSRRYLEGVATRLRERGRTVELIQPEGDPAAVLLEQARTLNADLIALTTHGRSGLSRLFYGSVAEAVLREAPCPVLLVRTHEDGAS